METWLEFLRGPVFRFAIIVAALGMARHVIIAVWGVVSAYRKANDKNLPWGKIILGGLGWMVPVKKVFTAPKTLHSVLTIAMHVGLILVPIFLLDHILLWQRGLGIAWPAIPRHVADIFTVAVIFLAAALIVERVASRTMRVLSKPQDYFLLGLIMAVFITGFIASRPWNPMSWEASMLIHVAAGNAILVLIPFTKLAHMVVWPINRITNELAWKFPARAGEQVALTLDGKEVRPI